MPQKRSAPLPLVILISGSGSNLRAIIDACGRQQINANIAAVISNRPDAYGLKHAETASIATHVVNHRDYPDRRSFDAELENIIDGYKPGLVVLAGFMRILTPEFVNHYLGRMVNIHPSLLPSFQGLNTHQRALDAGADKHGVSVHFVTPELDGGPVIIRAEVPVETGDNAKKLAAKVLKEEHRIYPEAIGWYADGRLQLENNQALLDGQPIKQFEKTIECDTSC